MKNIENCIDNRNVKCFVEKCTAVIFISCAGEAMSVNLREYKKRWREIMVVVMYGNRRSHIVCLN